jgi:hypothetical protein
VLFAVPYMDSSDEDSPSGLESQLIGGNIRRCPNCRSTQEHQRLVLSYRKTNMTSKR